MKKLITIFSLVAALTIGAFAQNTRQAQDAVRSLNSKLDDIEQSFRYQMQSNSIPRDLIDQMAADVRDLRGTVADLQNNLDRHRDNRSDVQRVVEAAKRVDENMAEFVSNRQMERDWQDTRQQVERLGQNYGLGVRWDDHQAYGGAALDTNIDVAAPAARRDPQRMPPVSNNVPNVVSVGLSGTYTLDRQASENVDDIVRGSQVNGQNEADLRDKLEAPDQIAIDIRGNQVTLATSKASPVTFIADGRDKTQNSNGRTVRLRATINANSLVVSSIGGETDYNITFESISGGRALKVSRRITTDYLSQTVFAESLYNKSDSVARLDIGGNSAGVSAPAPDQTPTTYDPKGGYSDNDQSGTIVNGGSNNGGYGTRTSSNGGYNGGQPRVTTRTGDFVIPYGVTLSGRLENEVNTKISQNGDRVRLTVQSPAEYRGAVIEGYVSGVGRSGKVSGNSNVTFNFERITLRDGKTYDFAGQLTAISDAQGKSVKVDNEGTARGDSQTRQTATRGAAGGGLGALIGAIAGGGKGAAIGAIIGAGAAGSTVLITGQEDIQLLPGSTITIQSTSPKGDSPR